MQQHAWIDMLAAMQVAGVVLVRNGALPGYHLLCILIKMSYHIQSLSLYLNQA